MSSTSIQRDITLRPTLRPAFAGGSTLRLTRRGKVVVVLFTLAVLFCVFALRSAPAASTSVVHHQATATVIVTPGDTLWDIARRVDPTADPRDVVAQIEEMNSLSDDGVLHVGEPLLVPASRP